MEQQFIYSNKLGLGYVTENKKEILHVNFIDGTKIIRNDTKFFKVVPSKIVEFISLNEPGRFFDSATLKKSEPYCSHLQFSAMSFSENQISVSVKGTKEYQVCIIFDYIKETIRCSCSCPVWGDCKHEAALYSYFYDFISLKIRKTNPILENKLDAVANKFFSLEEFKVLISELEKMTYEKAKNSFKYICLMPIDIELKAFLIEVISVFYQKDQKGLLDTLEDIDYTVMRKNSSMFYMYYGVKPALTLVDIMIHDFVNDKFIRFVSTFLSIKEDFTSCELFDKIFAFALSNCTREEKDSVFLELNDRNYNANKKFKYLVMKNYNESQYAKYMFLHGKSITQKVFEKIDTSTFFELIDYVDNPGAVLPYIISHVQELYGENRLKLIQTFHKISTKCTYEDHFKLMDLLQKNFPSAHFIESVKNIRCNDYYLKSNLINHDKDELNDYYYVNYTLERQEEKIQIHYFAFLKNNMILLDYVETISERLTETYITHNLFSDSFARQLVSKIKEIQEPYIKEDYDKAMAEVSKLAEERRQKFVMKKLNDFIDHDTRLNVSTLQKSSKVSFIYTLAVLNSQYISCDLKIGINKFYMIKNIKDLIHRFDCQLTYRYGKELEFYHVEENLTPEARDFYDFMMREGDTNYGYRDELVFRQRSFDHLFSLLKNQMVYVGKEEYLVRLDPVDFKIKIDENYHLNVVGLTKEDEVIYSSTSAYIVRNDKKTIDMISLKQMDLGFLQLAIDINDCNIKNLKDKFISNIYTRYPDYIEVDEKIKKEFQSSLMVIKTYFDYVNKVITVKSEMNKDSLIVQEKNFNYNDKILYQKYLSLLTAMGVQDNIISDEDSIYNFFNMDFSEFKKVSEVYLSESIMNKKTVTFTSQKLKVNYNSNTMSVFYEDSDYNDEELYELFKAIRHKKKYFILKNNVIVDLNNQEAKQFYQLVHDLNLNEKQLTKSEERPLYQSFKLLNYEQDVTMDDFIVKMIHDIAHYKEAKFVVPTLNAKYRKYQEEGYLWLKTLASYNLGGILADDMGLGKTLEIIMLLASDNTLKPSLIVCPKSLIFNWKSEFMKFASDEQVVEIYGNSAYRQNTIERIDPSKKVIYLTSYDSLRNDEECYQDKSFAYVIIDEGQYIKNAQSQKSQVVKKIKAMHKFALTGTPVENNIYDLWSLFDFLMPNYLDGLETFKSDYSKNPEYVNLVAKKVAPFILRRTKGDVLKDLPNKYEHIVTSEMNEDQRKLYDAHILEAQQILAAGGKAFDVLPMLMRLRQICVDPSTFIANYNKGSGKMDMLLSLVEEYIESDHRILIFSQFVSALGIVSSLLKKKSIKHYVLTGDTSSEERLNLCNSFNNNDEIKVFLISLKAGGTGLNLIGADTIIHLDPWWNVAAENQASDRAHRIGQTRNVEVIKLICRDSIEQRVIELQNIKKDLIDKLISNDDSSITKMRKEDLEYILK